MYFPWSQRYFSEGPERFPLAVPGFQITFRVYLPGIRAAGRFSIVVVAESVTANDRFNPPPAQPQRFISLETQHPPAHLPFLTTVTSLHPLTWLRFLPSTAVHSHFFLACSRATLYSIFSFSFHFRLFHFPKRLDTAPMSTSPKS